MRRLKESAAKFTPLAVGAAAAGIAADKAYDRVKAKVKEKKQAEKKRIEANLRRKLNRIKTKNRNKNIEEADSTVAKFAGKQIAKAGKTAGIIAKRHPILTLGAVGALAASDKNFRESVVSNKIRAINRMVKTASKNINKKPSPKSFYNIPMNISKKSSKKAKYIPGTLVGF